MSKSVNKFDATKVENVLKSEYKFVTDLFSILALPAQSNKEDEENETDVPKKLPRLQSTKTTRAASLLELQSRIDKLRKNKSTYREKLQKKNLKNRLKKKLKRDERNSQVKLNRAQKLKSEVPKSEDVVQKKVTGKPVFNSEDKMVFSKIDFTGIGTKKQKKTETNPKKLLEKVRQVGETVEQLKAAGETEKASLVKEKNIWKNALAKSQGDKVKDDPVLLKKSIQKLEQKKRSSKKKWDGRNEGVKKAKEERQKKRTANIEKRKKENKLHKLKKASKKGRVIPGF